MSNVSGGPGWLLGQDGKWYPPNTYNQPSETPSPPFSAQPQYESPMPGATQPAFGYEPGYQPPMQGGFQTGTQYGQPVIPKKSKKGAIIAIVILLVLLIGGGTVGYMVLSGNSDNPTSAVNRFMAALVAKDASTACKNITGETTSACLSELGAIFKLAGLSGSLKAANYQVSGTEALVSVVGQECGLPGARSNRNKCTSNSNRNYGLPAGSTTFSQAWVNATSNNSSIFVVPCEKLNGTWYVSLVLSSKFDDPTSAVNSFMSALFSKNASAACQYATGETTSECNVFVEDIYNGGNVSGSLNAANYQVSGTEALVTVVGQVCGGVFAQISGKKCQTNSNPNVGLPSGSTSFAKAWFDNNSNGSIFTVPCEKLNGTWYVYLQNTPSNPGNSGNSGNQGTSAPPVKPVSLYSGPMGILGAGAPQSNNMMWLLANSAGNKTIV
ncbi:MAG: hypothetical protein HKL80_09650 [Acidimicrobiales bacterium]|nr:hypothetical protein [Acidimicrobiales bacterium]